MFDDSTIAAAATPAGAGAIAVIRVSGKQAIGIVDGIFSSPTGTKRLVHQKSSTVHFGSIMDSGRVIDEVLVSIFRAPRSFTGDDTAEISCHGSVVIQQQILELLVRSGARLAQPGEFTLRAFLNGKMDLSQAEGVADLIAASSEVARRVALQQMRGGFSERLRELRGQLVHFASMVELELDFADEDVEFADRQQLEQLVQGIGAEAKKLIDSFSQGNVIKNGVPVAIAGKPNVGKSTLLNRLLNEERAIVSEHAGTTRDAIEDTVTIEGVVFRFIDTAGLRETTDAVESIGIERAMTKIEQARVVIYMLDAQEAESQCVAAVEEFMPKLADGQTLVVLINKDDISDAAGIERLMGSIGGVCKCRVLAISAKYGHNIDALTDLLVEIGRSLQPENQDVVVVNVRHYNALVSAYSSINQVIEGLKLGISGDLLAIEIRQVLYHIGTITGEVTNDEILGSIFSKFCIGK